MELFDFSLWGVPIALPIAVVAEGFDRVIGFASMGALFGALLGVWLSARRSPP
jgi:hypothetical protein